MSPSCRSLFRACLSFDWFFFYFFILFLGLPFNAQSRDSVRPGAKVAQHGAVPPPNAKQEETSSKKNDEVCLHLSVYLYFYACADFVCGLGGGGVRAFYACLLWLALENLLFIHNRQRRLDLCNCQFHGQSPIVRHYWTLSMKLTVTQI